MSVKANLELWTLTSYFKSSKVASRMKLQIVYHSWFYMFARQFLGKSQNFFLLSWTSHHELRKDRWATFHMWTDITLLEKNREYGGGGHSVANGDRSEKKTSFLQERCWSSWNVGKMTSFPLLHLVFGWLDIIFHLSTMLQKLSKCEVKAWLCWKLTMLPPLRFYVKSNFGEFK